MKVQTEFSERWQRGLLAVTVVAWAGCQCGTIGPTGADPLRVSASELRFMDTWVGATRRLAVEVTNPTRVRTTVSLSVEPPFAVPTSLTVEGGESVMLEVTFTPTTAGPFQASLQLDAASVALSGTGLAPLSCPTATCRQVAFDPEAGACTTVVSPDGEACASSCVNDGQCLGGECRGTLAEVCNSNDPCVVDGCGPDGCIHVPRECPVADRCQAVFCDRDAGCQSRPVDDGTPCGEATCEEAEICLGGSCQRRPRPNAQQECRYTAMAVMGSHTCVVTRGEQLRCWGANSNDVQGRGWASAIAPPGLAVGITGVRKVAGTALFTFVGGASGVATRVGRGQQAAIDAFDGFAAGGWLRPTACGLSGGVVKCSAFPDGGVVVVVNGGARFLSMARNQFQFRAELCVNIDAGVMCGPPDALLQAPLSGVEEVLALERGAVCACDAAGAVRCWISLVDGGVLVDVWSAGASHLSSSAWRALGEDEVRGELCALVDGGVVCVTIAAGPTFGPSVDIPGSRLQGPIAELGTGDGFGCVRLGDGRVACWGHNRLGQLGDRSAQPAGLQELPFRATWMATKRWASGHYAEADLRAFQVSSTSAQDGGERWLLPMKAPARFTVDEAEGRCERRDGGTFCGGIGPLPVDAAFFVPLQPEPFSGPGVCVADQRGTVRCFRSRNRDGGAGVREVSDAGGDAGEALVALEAFYDGYCAVRADGEVRCWNVNPPLPPLRGVTALCLGQTLGCATLKSGAVTCWNQLIADGGAGAVPGAWPVARQHTCGSQHACLLAGTNIVQCWGDNSWGQLGRNGPNSSTAVAVPMPEPVRRIAAAANQTCALLASGRIVCWGENNGIMAPLLESSDRPRLVTQ